MVQVQPAVNTFQASAVPAALRRQEVIRQKALLKMVAAAVVRSHTAVAETARLPEQRLALTTCAIVAAAAAVDASAAAAPAIAPAAAWSPGAQKTHCPPAAAVVPLDAPVCSPAAAAWAQKIHVETRTASVAAAAAAWSGRSAAVVGATAPADASLAVADASSSCAVADAEPADQSRPCHPSPHPSRRLPRRQ